MTQPPGQPQNPQQQQPWGPPPGPPRRRRRWRGILEAAAALIALIVIVAVAASKPSPAPARSTPAATVTVTATAPAPTQAAVTVTVTASPPPPAQGTVIGTFRGTGNQVTPQFDVPPDGSYIVTWSYSGNVDTSFGSSQPTNFAITETGSGEGLGLPNDIAASGSGSTEVTGASGTDRLNVQAAGQWTIKITSA